MASLFTCAHPRSRLAGCLAAVATTAALGGAAASAQAAESAPTPAPAAPNLIPALSGFNQFWQPDATNGSSYAGTVKDAKVLERNDRLAVWINHHATKAQRFVALQDSEYNDSGTSYDESVTVSTGLGSVLGPLYVKGLENGDLPLTAALLNDENGSAGTFVGTGAAKVNFDFPRPYLPTTPGANPYFGALGAPCNTPTDNTTIYNAASLRSIRVGRAYADADGDLKIKPVPDTIDTTHEFSPDDVPLSATYSDYCDSASFPSGHTTNAYESGIMLATLLPQLAPEILARVSEQGLDRVVLGVHYPLDTVGGRIGGEDAESTLWANQGFREQDIDPARQELSNYLEDQCGGTIVECYDSGAPYEDNPFAGARLPGGTAEIVTNRTSAIRVYEQRLTFGFPTSGTTGLPPSVPADAPYLLMTAFPDLSTAQRTQVLAQTEIPSGYPLDQSGPADGGSWQRLNLAAAMSATVHVNGNGTVTVTRIGGLPTETGPGSVPHALRAHA